MASVDISQISKQEHDELSCAYAALILHDEGLEITVIHIQVFLMLYFRVINLQRLLRQVEMKLNHSGHKCLLKLLRDKILKSYCQQFHLPQLVLLLQLLEVLLLQKLLPRKKRKRKKKKLMSIWEDSSEMTIESIASLILTNKVVQIFYLTSVKECALISNLYSLFYFLLINK